MNLPVNLPTIEPVAEDDIDQLVWAEEIHEAFMDELEKEFFLGLPFNQDAIMVCLMCRSPLNELGDCDCCGQRSDMPLPSNLFIVHF